MVTVCRAAETQSIKQTMTVIRDSQMEMKILFGKAIRTWMSTLLEKIMRATRSGSFWIWVPSDEWTAFVFFGDYLTPRSTGSNTGLGMMQRTCTLIATISGSLFRKEESTRVPAKMNSYS